MNKAYIVRGCVTYEYSPASEWNVIVFLDEQKADDYASKATNRAREIFALYNKQEKWSLKTWNSPEYQNEFDKDNFDPTESQNLYYETIELPLGQ